jgi:hypothetical protein
MNTDAINSTQTNSSDGENVLVPFENPHPASQPLGPDSTSFESRIEDAPVHRKVAKLPKPLRDLINTMLDDALPAREIVTKLEASTNPPLPYPISAKNLADWRNTGYQRYLAQRERIDLFQANCEGATDFANNEPTTIPEATLQIVANQYFELMLNFSPESLREKLSEDPMKYTRFLNVFARLVREIVYLRKFRDASRKEAAAAQQQLKKLDPDRDLSDSELDLLVNRMDKVFKVARPHKPEQRPNPNHAGRAGSPQHAVPSSPCSGRDISPKGPSQVMPSSESGRGVPPLDPVPISQDSSQRSSAVPASDSDCLAPSSQFQQENQGELSP